ncbi:hypothetical protein BCA37_11780 [Mycobacterium sp. djl-10]|nr:hypothetical protein BCA37_11780 [Mycobacterium sp. djl-10]
MVIIDDDDIFRAVVRALLTRRGFTVVGEAGEGRLGLEAVAQYRPQYVLIDVQLPDIDGFRLSDQVRRVHPRARILLTSTDADPAIETPVGYPLVFLPKDHIADHDLRALFDGG